ncbi:hypothetical protein PGT21_005904 [Puccinia graminis f. sp. tritici]|uniref:Uncharacterized protein n=1 Tax=Puccinia graminis f. sp. tritici TaxID=56615 RepID=A0A5B0PR76_PUCGR|nr:hypothetical protein PGT21_005904 [Puccinia graminis f. sp. tritici]
MAETLGLGWSSSARSGFYQEFDRRSAYKDETFPTPATGNGYALDQEARLNKLLWFVDQGAASADAGYIAGRQGCPPDSRSNRLVLGSGLGNPRRSTPVAKLDIALIDEVASRAPVGLHLSTSSFLILLLIRPPPERRADISRCENKERVGGRRTTSVSGASASPTMDLSESKSWPPLLPRLLSAMVFQNPPCVGFESQRKRLGFLTQSLASNGFLSRKAVGTIHQCASGALLLDDVDG